MKTRLQILREIKNEKENDRQTAIIKRLSRKVSHDYGQALLKALKSEAIDGKVKVEFTPQMIREIEFIEYELGYENHKFSDAEVIEMRRYFMRDFIEDYYKWTADAEQKTEFALNNLSDETISALRKEIYTKPKNWRKVAHYDYVACTRSDISDFLKGKGELILPHSEKVLQEIRLAFEPLK